MTKRPSSGETGAIVTYAHRYKPPPPPRKQQAVPLTGPAVVTKRARKPKVAPAAVTAPPPANDDGKPAPKLRGKRQPLALALPPELLRTIDRFAAQERRSRANMIEIILDDYAQARLAKEAA